MTPILSNNNNEDKYTLDRVYDEIGDGLTQKIMAYVNAIGRTSGAFFTCSFAFLILKQNYLCSYDGG